MIIGDFSSWEEEKGMYSAALAEALNCLRTANFEEMPDGVYPLNDDGASLIVKTVETSPFEEVRPEKHERFIDIHYMISGMEKIGFARDNTKNIPANISPIMEDHIFFDNLEQEMELVLYPGQFAVFMPSDVHRPWCTADKDRRTVRKALIKLPVSRLA